MRIKIKETKGFSLVVVIVFVAMLSSLAIVAVKMGALTAISMYNAGEGKQAYYIAEAGFQHALFKLNQNPAWRGDLSVPSFEGGAYDLNVSQANQIDDLTITAVGSYNGTEHTIVRVIPPPEKEFIIVAFAGTGVAGNSGEGGLAIAARLRTPRGLSKKADGDIFIADTGNSLVKYVDSVTKNIYRFAGVNGASGYNCDDCNPLISRLRTSEGVFVDQAGNVFIADTSNHIVRKVIAGGNIVNVAGRPQNSGFSGDGGPAINARLNNPRDVVVDADGNVYIADTTNCRIRKVNATDGKISTFAGNGACAYGGDNGPPQNARLNSPRGLALDMAGNLYIADRSNNRIRKIDMAANTITTIAGNGVQGYSGDDGPATAARLNRPQGISVNQFGSIYIADTNNHRIRKVDSSGTITTWAGNGTQGSAGDGDVATSANLNSPARVLSFDDIDGHVFISDTSNNRVREVTNAY